MWPFDKFGSHFPVQYLLSHTWMLWNRDIKISSHLNWYVKIMIRVMSSFHSDYYEYYIEHQWKSKSFFHFQLNHLQFVAWTKYSLVLYYKRSNDFMKNKYNTQQHKTEIERENKYTDNGSNRFCARHNYA